jgi:hypothetical protein
MASARARSLIVWACFLGVSALAAGGAAAGCGNANDDADGPCTTFRGEGCACAYEGQTTECADTISIGSDSLECSSGTRTCSGGRWGACIGTHSTIQSLPRFSTKSGPPAPCASNPCDPGCMTFDETPADVDAGGGTTVTPDGGVTLAEGGEGGSGDGAPGSGPCTGIACNIDLCDGDAGGYQRTQLTGKVYDPAGKNPIYNALVYVPNATVGPLTEGVSCDSCSTGSGSPIVSTLTDYTGSFTLKGVPNGSNVPLVIQSGKWRRQVTIPSVTKCVTNDTSALTGSDGLPLVRFPRNRAEGNIPRIAFVSGSADPFQCVLSKMGIDVSSATGEIGPPTIAGAANPDRIHYYQGTSSSGQNISATLNGPGPSASTLYDTAAHLNVYDAVILACEGGEYDKGTTIDQNLVDYAGRGGRVFATHFSYAYLEKAPAATSWPSVVEYWNHTSYPVSPMTAIINRSFAKGDNFAKWLGVVGASPTVGELAIQEGRHDYDFVDATKATPWMYSNSDGSVPPPDGSKCAATTDCAAPSACVGAASASSVLNPSFESGLTSWTPSGGNVTSDATTTHAGTKSVKLGFNGVTGSGIATDNSVSQTFTAPATDSQLGFWIYDVCQSTSARDWATVDVLDNTTGVTTSFGKICFNGGWAQGLVDLVASHSYTLTLLSHDDNRNTGGRLPSWAFFDDVTITTKGVCTGKTCTADADCSGGGTGAACWGGKCIPGHDMEPLMAFNTPIGAAPASQCGRVVFSDFHVSASALNGAYTTFPEGCNGGDLSAQEKALEFMIFDLTACLTADYVPPSPPAGPPFYPATIHRDYTASCKPGYIPIWHFFDWMTHTPSDSKISFTVQTGNTLAALTAMTPLPISTVNGPPVTAWTGKDLAAIFAATTPATKHGLMLRVNMTLTPSSDRKNAPVLDAWRQAYTCVPNE